jgi:hypothetical protein
MIIIATDEELWLLTKMERIVYESFRLRGKTKEMICEEQKITPATFRNHWTRAMKKILDGRKIMENPLRSIAKGKDILAS